MPAIRAVTLDAAGTLFAPSAPVAQTYAQIAAEFGAHLDAGRLSSAFREHFAAMPPMAFGPVDAHELPRHEQLWWRDLVLRVTEAAGGVDAFDAYFERLYARFAEPSAWCLFADVKPLLTALSDLDIPVAVVSNFDSRLETIIEGLGIAGAFEAIVYSTSAGSAKPDPQIFDEATRRLAVAPAHCLHVGDSPGADLSGARSAGLQARLVARGGVQDDDHITSLMQAAELVTASRGHPRALRGA